MTLKNLATTR